MPEYKSPTEMFSGVISFYREYVFSLLDFDSVEAINTVLAATRDEGIDEVDFIWSEFFIEGNNAPCFQNTIIDIYDPDSMIFQHFKRFTTSLKVLRCLLTETDYSPYKISWEHYCRDIEITIPNVIEEIQSVVEVVNKEGGVFDQILDLVKVNQWKLL